MVLLKELIEESLILALLFNIFWTTRTWQRNDIRLSAFSEGEPERKELFSLCPPVLISTNKDRL